MSRLVEQFDSRTVVGMPADDEVLYHFSNCSSVPVSFGVVEINPCSAGAQIGWAQGRRRDTPVRLSLSGMTLASVPIIWALSAGSFSASVIDETVPTEIVENATNSAARSNLLSFADGRRRARAVLEDAEARRLASSDAEAEILSPIFSTLEDT